MASTGVVGKGKKPREKTAAAEGVKSFRQAVAEIHAIRPPLTQNLHAVRASKEKVLEVAIGREVRAFRKKPASPSPISPGDEPVAWHAVEDRERHHLAVADHAAGAVEGARRAVTAFFRRFEEERSAVFVKAGEGLEIERRGTRAGHQYNLLGHVDANTSGVVVEPYLITLSQNSDVFPTFQHEGMEFLYMLEGEVVYRHGSHLFRMLPGDSLFFDRRAARARGTDETADPLSVHHLLSAAQPGRLTARCARAGRARKVRKIVFAGGNR